MIILGIDPGSVRIGFGIIEKIGGNFIYLDSGLIEISKEAPLRSLENGLTKILKKTKPEIVGVEKLFFAKNRKTALAVAESRGVIMNTIGKHGIPIREIAPSEVKLALTGSGQAPKEGVYKMVKVFLGGKVSSMIDDASDALAIAIAVSNKIGIDN